MARIEDMSVRVRKNKRITVEDLRYHNLVMGVWLNNKYITYYTGSNKDTNKLVIGISNDRGGCHNFRTVKTYEEAVEIINDGVE